MCRSTFQWCAFVSFCIILLYLWATGSKINKTSNAQVSLDFNSDLSTSSTLDLETELSFSSANISIIDELSLTAILPVTENSLPNLRNILEPLVHPDTASVYLGEILLVSQDHIISNLRSELFTVMSQMEFSRHIQCSIRSWKETLSESIAIISAVVTSSTDWVLILEEDGLNNIDEDSRRALLNPPPIALPLGLRGVRLSHNASCITPSAETSLKASYLIPPFVMPKSLTAHVSERAASWADFGAYVSSIKFGDGRAGGIVLPQFSQNTPDMNWCSSIVQPTSDVLFSSPSLDPESLFSQWSSTSNPVDGFPIHTVSLSDSPIIFGILLLSIEDLKAFAPVACHLEKLGHTLRISLYNGCSFEASPKLASLKHSLCTLSYRVLSADESPTTWLDAMEGHPEVIVTLSEMTEPLDGCSSTSIIRIPRKDLQHTQWMSSLTSHEWRDWGVPQVTLSIITKDRPQSLSRLLESITDARYFGDKVDLRANLEQSSDLETMNIIKNFRWLHGSMFVHHRVIHGGLLTAVAESWYPDSQDAYAVILEDDVELSPLFYAWIKMTLLRYRYGLNRGKAPHVFGISLYQPKNLELDLSGRRPFNASHVLLSTGIHALTPYLSPIPCSWGAVYFPEHWMEFHDFLALRFSEDVFNLSQIIVPNVRSNQWTRSWKKYFIELVYLRGYVMLYPNFPQHVSLSTNHLEVGSHVKIRSMEKRESFSVPLMKLGDAAGAREVDLLDLPNRSLPPLASLPVLNLTGVPTTLDMLKETGMLRYLELGLCGDFAVSGSGSFNAYGFFPCGN
ncbi:glycosyltransferase 2 [Lentinula guzmanii]|uniref:Glycosyltransferase 2 n=1 Tax=Lentinula guzmanii TaxID=2804957 RepID=A0AA38MZE2_9AGAR|nr:glycosyltransferase 2 [Lentinula guzmanii]